MDMRADRENEAWKDEQSRLEVESIVPDFIGYSPFIDDFPGDGGSGHVEWMRGEMNDCLTVLDDEDGRRLDMDEIVFAADDWSYIPKQVCGCKGGIQWVAEYNADQSSDDRAVYFIWRRDAFIDMMHKKAQARPRVL